MLADGFYAVKCNRTGEKTMVQVDRGSVAYFNFLGFSSLEQLFYKYSLLGPVTLPSEETP